MLTLSSGVLKLDRDQILRSFTFKCLNKDYTCYYSEHILTESQYLMSVLFKSGFSTTPIMLLPTKLFLKEN